MKFQMQNDSGKLIDCFILHKFIFNNKNYLIYTDKTIDENGDFEIQAVQYQIINKKLVIQNIEDDTVWNQVDIEWRKINE